MNDIPLVRTNNVDDINTSLIAVKKTISEKGDIREVNVDVSVHTDAVDEVTLGEMSPVTSNAVSVALSEESNNRNSAITNAIGNLSANSVGGSEKYISAISEADGVISATASNLATTVQSGNNQPVTSNAVYDATKKINSTSITITNHADKMYLYRCGNLVLITLGSVWTSLNAGNNPNLGTIPNGYRPCIQVQVREATGQPHTMTIETNGNIIVYNYGSAITQVTNGHFYFTWITND